MGERVVDLHLRQLAVDRRERRDFRRRLVRTAVHLALHFVRRPAERAERRLRRRITGVEVSRRRFDCLRHVGRDLARERRFRFDLRERRDDLCRHPGESAPGLEAGEQQDGDEDAESNPEAAANRIELRQLEEPHLAASTCMAPPCTRVMTMLLPMGSPSALKRIAPVTPWNAMFSDKFARYSRILTRSGPTCSTAWASSFVAS